MPGKDQQPKSPTQPQTAQPQSGKTPATTPKPDKNVVVPKYDLLTEGYDPAKLKKRVP